MNQIPSLDEISQNFRKDIAVPGWRGIGLPPEGTLKYEGRQKQFLNYLVGLAKQNETSRKKIVAKIKTEKDILKRGNMARKILRDVQGLSEWPKRTPLNAKAQAGFEKEGYRVEHVILESRPNFFVTGALYLPKSFKPPYPVVLYVLGHSQNGKTNYQRLPANLALKGIAAFAIDPAGQGERDEYVDISTGQRTVTRACMQHGVAGDPAYLVGSNFGAHRIWDSMRCIDYLQSRKDIQGDKIGISGTSGGGWESLWVGAIDQRVTAINTNCYTTTFHKRIERREVDAEPDCEQDPFGLLSAGLEAADLYMACYPRPISMGVTLHDIFPYEGAKAVYNEARGIYTLGKKKDRIAITVSDAKHMNTLEMRMQTYRWMMKWLKNEPAGDDAETPEFNNEVDETLNCTPTGIVLTSLGGKTSAEFSAEWAREIALKRKAAARKPGWLGSVPKNLKKLLFLDDPQKAGKMRRMKERAVGQNKVSEIQIDLPGRITLGGHLWRPSGNARKSAVIYISPKTKSYDPLANETCKALADAGNLVLDFDPRGMGPMDEAYQLYVPLMEAAFTYDGFLLGKPVLGMRVADILLAVEQLVKYEKIDPKQITLHGNDYGALLALFAGCIDKRIGSVVEENGLTSYSSLCWNRSYAWPANVILPHVLKQMELADIRASIAPRKLTVIHPLDHLKERLSADQASQQFAEVAKVFKVKRAKDALNIQS